MDGVQMAHESLRDLMRACDIRGIFDDNGELVAAGARHRVGAADAAAEGMCHLLQKHVAGVMAE